MRETKIYCDHCKKEIDGMKDYEDITIVMNHKDVSTDLCVDCFEKLYSIIKNFCSNESILKNASSENKDYKCCKDCTDYDNGYCSMYYMITYPDAPACY